jgi:cholest-4-en-3-one 26-monooxygenase
MTIALEDIDVASHDVYTRGVPHDLFARLRREAPVFKHRSVEPEQPEFFWALTRHADIVAVSRAWETYSSARKGCLLIEDRNDLQIEGARMIVDQDPPEHTHNRRRISRVFTPRALRTLDGHYRETAGRVIDEALKEGAFDFVPTVAAELPLIAIAEFLGIPVDDRRKVFDWSNRLIGNTDPEYGGGVNEPGAAVAPASLQFEAAEAAMAELYAYAHELAAQRRLDPQDDIITTLLMQEGDDALTEHEFDMFILLLAVAGNETTRNAISHGTLALIEHPEAWHALQDDHHLLDSAIEEILRWATPVMQFRRTATCNTVLHGTHIAEGDSVVMYYSSANRDEAVFDDPFTFDITRSPNPHVGFGGGGHHFCLGANLARVEMKILFEEMLNRIDRIELAGEVSRLRSNFINGIKHLPTKITPR